MPNVFIAPAPSAHQNEGGILRVVNALRAGLPAYGWNVVEHPGEADLINSHATEMIEGYEHLPVVQSSHGLMWTEYFGREYDVINARLVACLKRADAITAPSQWVARAIARGIACQPRVIYHGVNADEWQPLAAHGGYALWNKARTDAVSDHHELEKLAGLMPAVPFVSTIGKPTANLKICGVQSYEAMRETVRGAGVYLALARETFGISTLEAMACGVPIAGWDYGGQHEIVTQGETGYLAEYGDWDALRQCVARCLAERERLGANARADVLARWGWQKRIAKYARLFDGVLADSHATPKVSVIVTCYNLGRYLEACIKSVTRQTSRDWECLIVDDGSTDDSRQVAEALAHNLTPVHYIRTPHNLGLPAARNYGIAHARGKYILPLDADDLLTPDAVETLSRALDADKSLHIAYGHLRVMSADGSQVKDSGWEHKPFAWSEQLAHHNQLHYSAMMRRSIFERTQGYRRRSWQAEDAEFWCYATSWGFNAARVTNEPTLIYRLRGDSKTRDNKAMDTAWSDGDWTAWTPYLKAPQATPFGAQGRPTKGFWNVPHHAAPDVSIVIPVGGAHTELLQDALDSVLAQTCANWELIIVNDSGKSLDRRGYAFATWLETGGSKGTGAARNLGVKHARAPLILFLDADDFLQPTFLSDTLAAYAQYPDHLIYTDWYKEFGTGELKVWQCPDFECAMILRQMVYCATVLHPKAAFEAVGGFDESLYGWEDWDYFIKLAIHGVKTVHLAKPLLTYRYHTGKRRENAYQNKAELLPAITGRYKAYIEGTKAMG